MKYHLFILFIFLTPSFASAQQHYDPDSVKKVLNQSKEWTKSTALTLSELADYYGFLQSDSCLKYANQTIALSQKLNYPYGRYRGYFSTFHGLNCQGNYTKAFEAVSQLKEISEKLKNDTPLLQVDAYYFSGVLYREMEDYPNAVAQLHQCIAVSEKFGGPISDMYFTYSQLALICLSQNKLDSAKIYAQKGYNLGILSKKYAKYYALAIGTLGNVEVKFHHYDIARRLFIQAIDQSRDYNKVYFEARNYYNLASLYHLLNQEDSCIYFAKISLQLCEAHDFAEFRLIASKLLTNAYELKAMPDSTLKYMRIMNAAKDSVFSQGKIRQFQQYSFNEINRLEQKNREEERSQNRIRTFALSSILMISLLLAFVLYRNSILKQKAKIKIEKAYEELKATQAQLIQSEKMASLGELTAGIAHEIQNPLNFVNNFSEVNVELIDELKSDLNAGKISEAAATADGIRQNLEKVIHHGQRADGIVKGMLEHSRANQNEKESTDLNALADEYLRLSYLSFRAKDKTFNVTLKKEFDPSLGNFNIVPQDIGRVFQNLFNNAFYSVMEKRKLILARLSGGDDIQSQSAYEPMVSVSTKRLNSSPAGGGIEIRVRDNGIGIPKNVLDKIFNPFFTTKAAGQGTGLGLSLSYDIITKEHGGTLTVDTLEGEYAEFIIFLPMNGNI